MRRGKRVDTNGKAVFTLHFRMGIFRGVVKGLIPSRPAGVAEARSGSIRWGNILLDKIVEYCQTPGRPGEALKHFHDCLRADSAASPSSSTLTQPLLPACSDNKFGLEFICW